MTTTTPNAGIDLDKLEALARTVDDFNETIQPFVSTGGQVVIGTFSMSGEQVDLVARLYDALPPATVLQLVDLARRAEPSVAAGDERALRLIKELSRISMSLAADLVSGADYTFQGHDYLDRNAVVDRVMQWRAEWDATGPLHAELLAEARAALASPAVSQQAAPVAPTEQHLWRCPDGECEWEWIGPMQDGKAPLCSHSDCAREMEIVATAAPAPATQPAVSQMDGPEALADNTAEFLSTLQGASKEATDEWIAGFVRQHFGIYIATQQAVSRMDGADAHSKFGSPDLQAMIVAHAAAATTASASEETTQHYTGGRFIRYINAPAGSTVTYGPEENTAHVHVAPAPSRDAQAYLAAELDGAEPVYKVSDLARAPLPAQGVLDSSEGLMGLRPYEFTVCGTSLRWYLKRDVDVILSAAPAQAGDAMDEWQPIETAPHDEVLLLAYEFDRPGDWRIKVGGYWNGGWEVFGASWTPTRWKPLPVVPTVSDYAARRAAMSASQDKPQEAK